VTTADTSGALAAALTLGLPAFPCRASKAPACPHGFREATADPSALRDLWRRHPGPLIGVPTGEASGLDVLDIDAPGHPEAAEWWRRHRHCELTTRTHRTRSGGLHVLFGHTAGLRCWAGRPVPGIDGRADGGYVVWWPAAGEGVICDATPAPWPTWLLAELHSPLSAAPNKVTIPDGHTLVGLVRKVARAAPGERNAVAFWAACRAGEMAASGLIGADIAAAIIANAAILSGLPQAEAERTARNGIRAGLGSTSRA
jgi:hypothetical protein